MSGRMTRGRPSPNRIVGIAALAFAVALVAQALLALSGVESEAPLRLFVTPLIGAAIVYAGLRGYSTAGRVRVSIMVALGLFLIASIV